MDQSLALGEVMKALGEAIALEIGFRVLCLKRDYPIAFDREEFASIALSDWRWMLDAIRYHLKYRAY